MGQVSLREQGTHIWRSMKKRVTALVLGEGKRIGLSTPLPFGVSKLFPYNPLSIRISVDFPW
jgi:hypothetical protein